MRYFKLGVTFFAFLAITAFVWASESDELREQAKAMEREAAELAEREAEVACFRREHGDAGLSSVAGRENEQRIACEGDVVRKGGVPVPPQVSAA